MIYQVVFVGGIGKFGIIINGVIDEFEGFEVSWVLMLFSDLLEVDGVDLVVDVLILQVSIEVVCVVVDWGINVLVVMLGWFFEWIVLVCLFVEVVGIGVVFILNFFFGFVFGLVLVVVVVLFFGFVEIVEVYWEIKIDLFSGMVVCIVEFIVVVCVEQGLVSVFYVDQCVWGQQVGSVFIYLLWCFGVVVKQEVIFFGFGEFFMFMYDMMDLVFVYVLGIWFVVFYVFLVIGVVVGFEYMIDIGICL